MAPVRKDLAPEKTARRILDRLWTEPGKSYAAFAGQHLLRRAAVESNASRKTKLEDRDVKNYVTQEHAYTQHAPRREKFPKPFYSMSKLWHLVESDLVETGRIENFNEGVRYLLLAIECTSRKLFVKPLKNKEGKTVTAAFKELLDTFPETPDLVRTDRGSEYKDAGFQSLLKKRGIKHLFASNTEKCAMCERAAQTLQRRLHRYMTHHNTYNFLPVLDDIVMSINNSPHASTKVAPNDFSQSDVYRCWEENYLKHMSHIPPKRPFRFNVGDTVRVSLIRHALDKSYRGTYSAQVFTIRGRRLGRPHSYQLSNFEGEHVDGLFYEEELILAKDRPDRMYMVDQVHQRRTNPKTKKKEVLVSWLGWPASVRDWIPEDSQVTTKAKGALTKNVRK